jgi:HPt (histidine-containing phosphotransfer) domain-containing protein
MDGLEATAAIRARERVTVGHVPIIAMTATAMQGDRELCLAAGMDDYVAKPIRPQELFDAIERVTESREPLPPAASDRPGAESAIDRSMLLARFDDDPELAAAVIDTFLQESPRLMSEIRTAFARGDAAALRRAAHTVKGAIGYFGDAAHRAAARLEALAQDGDLAAAEAAGADLEAEFGRLRPALDAIRRELRAGPKAQDD